MKKEGASAGSQPGSCRPSSSLYLSRSSRGLVGTVEVEFGLKAAGGRSEVVNSFNATVVLLSGCGGAVVVTESTEDFIIISLV